MVRGRNNGVVGRGFQIRECVGFCSGHKKCGRNKGVVVRRGCTVHALYTLFQNGHHFCSSSV